MQTTELIIRVLVRNNLRNPQTEIMISLKTNEEDVDAETIIDGAGKVVEKVVEKEEKAEVVIKIDQR